jgi:hypothetical protein
VVKMVLGGAGRRKGFKIVKSRKLKALGQTDFKSHVVTMNNAWHRIGNPHRPSKTRKVPEILKTRVHELNHIRHPKKRERAVQKDTNRIIKRMIPKQKKKLYNKKYLK